MKSAVIGVAVIAVVGISIAFYMIKSREQLKIYNPVELDPSLVAPELRSKMSGHRIGDFTLTNQFGETITAKDFEDKIYVADFFFTTCPGICPAMSGQMMRVQEANKNATDFRILSHTVQPEKDSPEVLLEYSKRYNADPKIWQFATGDRSVINSLARRSYFAAVLEEGHSEDEMVHTENFVLIDKEKRIRGIYDGTSPEQVDQLINDIETLRDSYHE